MNRSRFWVPVLISFAVAPICLNLAVASAGAGHGSYSLAFIFFPFTMLAASLFDSITVPFILLAIAQFPVYGMILGYANAKGKLVRAVSVVFTVHAVAVAYPFTASYLSLHSPTTRFIHAVQDNDVDTVKRMLDRGADPNMQLPTGPSVLMMACQMRHLEVAKLLLEKGADVNFQDRQGGFAPTALFCAVQFEQEQIVQLLLPKGADVTIKDSEGYTALERAKRSREFRVEQIDREQKGNVAQNLTRVERIISLLESAMEAQEKP